MPIIIAVCQHKGGVGKTTSTLGIGQALARIGKRVLLVDTDAQHNMTSTFPNLTPFNICHVLREEMGFANVIQPVGDNLDLVASHTDLTPLERSVGQDIGYLVLMREWLEEVANDYDFVLIDTPPSLGPMTMMALAATHWLLCPMRPDPFAFAGFHKLMLMVDKVRKHYNQQLQLKGVFLTQYHASYRGRLYADFAAALTQESRVEGLLLNTTIRTCVKVVEAHAMKQNLALYAPDCTAAQDYLALTHELLADVQ